MRLTWLAVALALAGCQPEQDSRISALEAKVSASEASIGGLGNRVDTISSHLAAVSSAQMEASSSRSAVFDPITEQGYSIADAGIVKLMLSVEDVAPYASGSRVTLLIGNPNAVTLNGVTGIAVYGPSQKQGLKQMKTTPISITDSILPGRWNKVQITLPEAPPKDIGAMSISLVGNQVRLTRQD